MIGRRVLINLGVFFVVSGLLIAYGAFTLLGNPFSSPRQISTVFEDASGLREGFSASMNGVVIGTVSGIDLDQSDGVRVTIDLDGGVDVPGDVEARVVRASAVGEQRIDLQPTQGGTAATLDDGAEVPAADDATPPEVSDVVAQVVTFLEALPADDLNTVVHEAAVAFEGRAEDLRTLIRATEVFNEEFLRREAGFRELLASSPPLLDSLAAVGPELRSALSNTRVLTEVLADRRFDLVELLRGGAELGEVGDDILADQKANLSCLLSDVATLSTFGARPDILADLSRGLDINTLFFGPIDAITPVGAAKDIGLGLPDRNNQTWLRVRTILPPAQPAASAYVPKRATPPTLPGAACLSRFGPGVGPATQEGGDPLGAGGELIPADAP